MVLGLLGHVTPLIFFSRVLRSEAVVYKSFFFRRAVLRKLCNIRFSYKHFNFSRICLLVKMASKTMTSSIATFVISGWLKNYQLSTVVAFVIYKSHFLSSTINHYLQSSRWPLWIALNLKNSFSACYDDFSLKMSCCSSVCSMN